MCEQFAVLLEYFHTECKCHTVSFLGQGTFFWTFALRKMHLPITMLVCGTNVTSFFQELLMAAQLIVTVTQQQVLLHKQDANYKTFLADELG